MHFNCLEKRQASVAAAKLAEDKKGRQPEEKKKKKVVSEYIFLLPRELKYLTRTKLFSAHNFIPHFLS